MSQQINLLHSGRSGPRSHNIWIVALIVVVIGGLGLYLRSVNSDNARLSEAAAAGDERIAQLNASVQAAQKRKAASTDGTVLAAEIAALRPRVDALNPLLTEIRSGNLGSPEGFSRYFSAVGGVVEDGVWLTGLTVAKGGNAVSVTGRALRNESVMQYARRLNDAFAPYGVRLNSLEMGPDLTPKPASANGPATVVFKIS